MNLIAEYQQSLIDAAYSVNVDIYGMNLIAEYQQSLIDAAYSVNVNIYGMNLIAEYDHLWLMRFIPWAYNNGISCINHILIDLYNGIYSVNIYINGISCINQRCSFHCNNIFFYIKVYVNTTFHISHD